MANNMLIRIFYKNWCLNLRKKFSVASFIHDGYALMSFSFRSLFKPRELDTG